MNIENCSTSELIDELEKRDGVAMHQWCDPRFRYEVVVEDMEQNGNIVFDERKYGPVVILEIFD